MSVILVNNDAFYGYLARRVANSHVKYQYFSLSKKVGRSFVPVTTAERKKILAEAEAYDDELAEWQAKMKQKAKAKCKPSKRNNTGVKGITLGRHRDSSELTFMVSISDNDGNPVMRSFNTNTGWEKAWRGACRWLSKTKGIPAEPLIKKVPSEEIKELVN